MRSTSILAMAAATAQATLMQPRAVNNTNPNFGVDAFPGLIGNFEFYGCVSSDNGFPTFNRVSSLPQMDLEFCAASCDTKYFGAQDTDCYCGTELSPEESIRTALSSCNIDCPGNDKEKCGGFLNLGRRDVPSGVLLTVYVRRDDAPTGDVTTTQTITTTNVETITTCAPEVTDCPARTTTTVATITAVPDYKGIVCYGDECYAQNSCDVCAQHQVICTDGNCGVYPCPNGQDSSKLIICNGSDCQYASGQKGKVVCYDGVCDVQQCNTPECQDKIVVSPPCSTCAPPAPPAKQTSPVCYGPDCSGSTGGSAKPTTPVQAGASAVLPAAAAVFGLVAGVAALL